MSFFLFFLFFPSYLPVVSSFVLSRLQCVECRPTSPCPSNPSTKSSLALRLILLAWQAARLCHLSSGAKVLRTSSPSTRCPSVAIFSSSKTFKSRPTIRASLRANLDRSKTPPLSVSKVLEFTNKLLSLCMCVCMRTWSNNWKLELYIVFYCG